MTNQKQPQIHPSLVEFANAALTGRLPSKLPKVASVMADAVGAERDRRVTELESENSTLRKALDDRRAVEGWCAEHGCRLELEFNEDSKRTVYLSIASGELEFSGEYPSIDEAFASAAEWVRGQS